MLVVIGVIAILISLLLPALGKARAQAQSVACLANLRTLGQAMVMYTSQSRGWLLGSANTTGAPLWDDAGLRPGITPSNSPEVVDVSDYMGPLIRTMKLNMPDLDSLDSVKRFQRYREIAVFQCPSYRGAIQSEFTASGAGAGQAISYNSALAFLLRPFRGSAYSGKSNMPGTPYWRAPANYQPKITSIGQTTQKIFLADGGKWSNGTSAPTFSITPGASHNDTPFADFGAFTGATKSYGRQVPNNIGSVPIDPRIFSYRHGIRKSRQATGSYRMNAVFYDGHAETMDDMQSSNPTYWVPSGSQMDTAASIAAGQPQVYPDVVKFYNLPATFIAP
ncbi:MAG: hypothetical protein H7144_06655 [Burkholderiales bacterium]|nr:hypothetical protein [Phycisphaerae bacterium]